MTWAKSLLLLPLLFASLARAADPAAVAKCEADLKTPYQALQIKLPTSADKPTFLLMQIGRAHV